MSQTATPPAPPKPAPPTATDAVVEAASTFAAAAAGFETANPKLYASIVGTLGTHCQAGLAPLAAAVVSGFVAHYALACAVPPTPGCWSADTQQTVTVIICAICSAAAGAAQHWWSKRAVRAAMAAPAKGA